MTTIEFLSHLQTLDIRLWLDGERLRYSAPKDALTPVLRAEISGRKDEIVALLHKAATRPPAIPALRPRDWQGPIPLSLNQRRMWLLDQLSPGNPAYNIPSAIRLHGDLDVPCLERSFDEIVCRHTILRTAFSVADGQPLQIVHADGENLPALVLAEMPALGKAERETEIRRLIQAEAQAAFPLERGPLIRAKLLRFAPDEHVLLVTMHHIVADGWSVALFQQELATLYTAFTAGRPSPLPELPLQYSDVALWQQDWLQEDVLQSQLAYWKENLAGAPPLLQFPADHPRPARQTFRGGHQSFEVPFDLVNSLKELSRQERCSLFMTLLAAFNLVLYRYSRQTDLIVGSPIANRDTAGTENLIGFFANTLILRTDLSGNPTLRELMQRVRAVTLGAYAHPDVPLGQIVDALQPERNPSYNPLFQVMFNFLDVPAPPLAIPGLAVTPIDAEDGITDFDLFLTLAEHAGGLYGSLGYNLDLFDAPTMQRFAAHFQALLAEFAQNADGRIEEISLLKQQAVTIAATFTAEPITEVLAYWLHRLDIPSRIAFAPYNQVFQQLLDPNSLLAGNQNGINIILLRLEDWLRFDEHAQQAGEWPDDAYEKIARNLEDLVAMLQSAVARSKTPYILCVCPPAPETVAHPRQSAFLQQMEARLLASTKGAHGLSILPSSKLWELYPVVDYYDAYADHGGHVPFTAACFAALGTLLARHIFAIRNQPYKAILLDCDHTLWKGVCGEDGPQGIEISPAYRHFQEFLVAQQEAGMLLCLVSKNVEEDVYHVFEQRTEMPLTLDRIVAARINWLPKSENIRSLAQELQLGLDSFIFIDDNAIECAEVRAHCPEVLTLQFPSDAGQIPVFLKHVWAFDRLHVTQEDRARTAMYQQNLERERVRQQSLTLEDFLASLELKVQIAAPTPDQLARVAQLTQRTNQFNTTTIRYTESEIQQLSQSGKECLAVDVRDRFGDYGLVGVVIFTSRPETLVVDGFLMSCRVLGRGVEQRMLSRLGEIAAERSIPLVEIPFVPSSKNRPAADFLERIGMDFKYEVPEGLVFRLPASLLASLPSHTLAGPLDAGQAVPQAPRTQAVTIDGAAWKTWRLAQISAEQQGAEQILAVLHAHKAHPSRSPKGAVTPRNETEQLLQSLWFQLLHAAEIGVHDSFFDLGGDSILATRMVSRIRETFQIELAAHNIFEMPTIAELAQRIETGSREGPQVPPILRVSRQQELPLSYGQQRLWALSLFDPDNTAYHIPVALRIRGDLDLRVLERCVEAIMQRHETLRTTFSIRPDGQPVQIVAPQADFSLSVVDLSQDGGAFATLAEKEARALEMATEIAHQPFDMLHGPLFRVSVLRLGVQDHLLVIIFHHTISDGLSDSIVDRELVSLYTAFSAGEASPLPELPVQYADFAVWQRNWLTDEVIGPQMAYWADRLAGAPELLALPTDRPRPAIQSYRGMHYAFELSCQLVDTLKAFGKQEGVTLFMTLLAAFKALLYRYTGQNDIIVGTPIANRDRTEIEGLIGVFADNLVVRSDLSGEPTFRDLLKQVRKNTLEAYAHRDIPFEKLVELAGHRRNPSYNPLFQVMISFLDTQDASLEIPGLTIEPMDLGSGMIDFDLFLVVREYRGAMSGWMGYNTDLFDEATIARMVGHLTVLLEAAVASPDLAIGQLPMLTEHERQQAVSLSAAAAKTKRPKLRPEQIRAMLKQLPTG